MRYVTVRVTRDTNSSHTGDFAPWEVPILELIHDPGNVVEVGETITDDPLPEAAEEYQRLESHYKGDLSVKMTYVAQVYGLPPSGIATLGKAIDKERVQVKRSRKSAAADELAA